ncbi:MAG: protein kinase, partial [Victivallales bacterium]|nr:protein kinase [Victivallales bacterium]
MKAPTIPNLNISDYCGSGAYGDVWIAEDLSGVKRAVKVLDKRKLTSMGVLRKEERALSLFRLNVPKHPNLVEILHVGETDDHLYYIMELADNVSEDGYEPDTLDHRLATGRGFSENECDELVLELLEAVKEIHSAGLVHRDIKPSNVIFVDKTAKLADIGLVASNNSEVSFGGTLDFMPPDHTVGVGADLYAMGKLLYCVFTSLTASEFPTLPDAIVKEMTPKRKFINKVVSKACAKSAELRFNNVEDFIGAMRGDAELAVQKRFSWKKAMLWLLSFITLPIAAIGYFLLGAASDKPPTHNGGNDGGGSAKSAEKPPVIQRPTYGPQTSEERKEFAKLLMKYQFYSIKKKYDKALW